MKNLLDLISVLFVSVCIGVISYICGYTKGYNSLSDAAREHFLGNSTIARAIADNRLVKKKWKFEYVEGNL